MRAAAGRTTWGRRRLRADDERRRPRVCGHAERRRRRRLAGVEHPASEGEAGGARPPPPAGVARGGAAEPRALAHESLLGRARHLALGDAAAAVDDATRATSRPPRAERLRRSRGARRRRRRRRGEGGGEAEYCDRSVCRLASDPKILHRARDVRRLTAPIRPPHTRQRPQAALCCSTRAGSYDELAVRVERRRDGGAAPEPPVGVLQHLALLRLLLIEGIQAGHHLYGAGAAAALAAAVSRTARVDSASGSLSLIPRDRIVWRSGWPGSIRAARPRGPPAGELKRTETTGCRTRRRTVKITGPAPDRAAERLDRGVIRCALERNLDGARAVLHGDERVARRKACGRQRSRRRRPSPRGRGRRCRRAHLLERQADAGESKSGTSMLSPGEVGSLEAKRTPSFNFWTAHSSASGSSLIRSGASRSSPRLIAAALAASRQRARTPSSIAATSRTFGSGRALV